MTWAIDVHLRGPFLRPSQERQRQLASLAVHMRDLSSRQGVPNVRLLEVTFIAPMPGHPVMDVAAIIDGPDAGAAVRAWLAETDLPEPSLVLAGHNAARFGDTDALGDPILLNHFLGSASAGEAEAAWRDASVWYERTLGVSNSTLLAFEQPSPFVIMNYASIPGPVPRFMAQQLLRPSFYRQVGKRLLKAGVRPSPVFARRVG